MRVGVIVWNPAKRRRPACVLAAHLFPFGDTRVIATIYSVLYIHETARDESNNHSDDDDYENNRLNKQRGCCNGDDEDDDDDDESDRGKEDEMTEHEDLDNDKDQLLYSCLRVPLGSLAKHGRSLPT